MPIVIAVVLIIILAAIIVKTLAPPNTIAGKIAGGVLQVAPAVGGALGVPGLGGLGGTPGSSQLTPAQIAAAQAAALKAKQDAENAAAATETRSPMLTLAVIGLAIFIVFTLLTSDPKKK